jgi:hypothetical protein
MFLRNATALRTSTLAGLFRAAAGAWPHDALRVRVRYSRSAPFSGACYYDRAIITINLGRANRYPFPIDTCVAPARTHPLGWRRERFTLEASDGYELALFLFAHEFYHWLIRLARRNPRQKEGMCDRFAARVLVDHRGAILRDYLGRPVPREAWDFQDLERFVRAAGRGTGVRLQAGRAARAC